MLDRDMLVRKIAQGWTLVQLLTALPDDVFQAVVEIAMDIDRDTLDPEERVEVYAD